MGSSPTRGSSFFLGKVTALGVLFCFALFVCLTLLASFFLPSHLSLKHVYMYTWRKATHTREPLDPLIHLQASFSLQKIISCLHSKCTMYYVVNIYHVYITYASLKGHTCIGPAKPTALITVCTDRLRHAVPQPLALTLAYT